MKSSLASRRENCVLLMWSSFFRVDFIAPVIPALQLDPKPISEISTTEASFHDNGGGRLSSVLVFSCELESSTSWASIGPTTTSFPMGSCGLLIAEVSGGQRRHQRRSYHDRAKKIKCKYRPMTAMGADRRVSGAKLGAMIR